MHRCSNFAPLRRNQAQLCRRVQRLCTGKEQTPGKQIPGPPGDGKPGKGFPIWATVALGGVGFTVGFFLSGVVDFGGSPAPLRAAESEYKLADPQGEVTQRVFLDVAIGAAQPERIIIGLYGKDAPKCAKNFSTLCRGDLKSKISNIPLTYKGTKFHRVIPNFMLQSGDFTRGDGTGGESIFGRSFKDEAFTYKHVGLGVLSMANRGKDTNSSQFFICTEKAPWLDGKHVVFGQVLHGAPTLRKIEAVGSRSGSLSQTVHIVQCGVLPDLADSTAANAPKHELLDETGRRVERIMK